MNTNNYEPKKYIIQGKESGRLRYWGMVGGFFVWVGEASKALKYGSQYEALVVASRLGGVGVWGCAGNW